MRHEQVNNRDTFDVIEVSTLEIGTSAALAGADLRPDCKPEAAVPDVPPAVGLMMIAVYVAIVALFALTIANSGLAPFMIAIDVMFMAAFFTVPYMMLKLERDPSRRPSMSRFMAQGMQTYTGHVSGGGALVQMFVVPGLLAGAVVAMGIIVALT